MAHLRSTIDLLAKILKGNGTTYVRAETFRLAKFNRNEAVEPLWRLLFELICYSEYARIDESVQKVYDQLSSDEIVAYVKSELQKKGYYSVDFAQLPNGMREGSRELLLAFGWVMSNDRIIEKFMNDRTAVLSDDTADLHEEETMNKRPYSCVNLSKLPGDIYSRVQQLLWLNNKLRLNLCSLHSLQCQRNRLKHKIHEATVGCKTFGESNHLSMFEVYLIQHPEFLGKTIDLLEKDSERLHDLMTWRDHEGIFWKWMESVLEAKLHPADDVSALPTSSSELADGLSVASSRLKESYEGLKEAVVKYEAIVEHIERLFHQKSSDVSSDVLDEITAGIARELAQQKANISSLHQESSSRLASHKFFREPKFLLDKERKTKLKLTGSHHCRPESQSSFLSLLSSDRNCDTATDIDDEIDRLQRHKQRLEKELGDKQSYLKTEIEKLSDRLTDAVCIPPLNRNLRCLEDRI